MSDDEARRLPNGLYRLHWAEGGHSLAAVGRLRDGTPWYAPTNWVTVPWMDWSLVARAVPLVSAPADGPPAERWEGPSPPSARERIELLVPWVGHGLVFTAVPDAGADTPTVVGGLTR